MQAVRDSAAARVRRTKQEGRRWSSGLPFARALRRLQQKQGPANENRASRGYSRTGHTAVRDSAAARV